ncbi:hypothetical protein CD798_14205 [Bacillaceae bacterium SAOS 7]|nr:hypothetical protein CD798_14205 [Bacillaceae bacterium SAOS 7]
MLKKVSADIAYGPDGVKNELAAYFSAYIFEVMAGIWFIVVTVVLIDHWKKILRQLQLKEEEVQKKKNDMLTYLAHDLRTPLTSVIGYAHLLDQVEHLETKEAKEYVKIIVDKSQLLEEMLDEFFEITKLETGNARLEMKEVNLAAMLQQLVNEYTPILREKELELQCEIIPQAMVECDVAKMERVFDNLMRNAMKYAVAQSCIDVTGKITKDKFLITFENVSEVMTEEQLVHMFEAFVRLEDYRSDVEGAGMGLTIVKEIIELHKGKVWAEYQQHKLKISIQMNIIKLS